MRVGKPRSRHEDQSPNIQTDGKYGVEILMTDIRQIKNKETSVEAVKRNTWSFTHRNHPTTNHCLRNPVNFQMNSKSCENFFAGR